MTTKSIDEVLAEQIDDWLAIPGVSGAGIGRCEGKDCINLYVSHRDPALRQAVPETLEGYRICIKQAGEFRAV